MKLDYLLYENFHFFFVVGLYFLFCFFVFFGYQEIRGAWVSSKCKEMQGEIRECLQISQKNQRS